MTAAVERAIAEARAAMATKRANLCRHGVSPCHECDRAKAARPAPNPAREQFAGTHPDAEEAS